MWQKEDDKDISSEKQKEKKKEKEMIYGAGRCTGISFIA